MGSEKHVFRLKGANHSHTSVTLETGDWMVPFSIGKKQEPTESVNTDPWLADNQSRDLNNELWLVVYLCRSVPGRKYRLMRYNPTLCVWLWTIVFVDTPIALINFSHFHNSGFEWFPNSFYCCFSCTWSPWRALRWTWQWHKNPGI